MAHSPTDTSFEAAYLERAARALEGHSVDVVVCDRRARADAVALGGWWCRADAAGVVVLPNPWDDRGAIAEQDARCWRVTRALTERIARWLDDLHGTIHGERYWDLLLGPLLQIIVTAVVDRRLFAQAVRELAPDVPAVAGAAPEPAATSLDAVNAHHGDDFNRALTGELLRRLGQPTCEPGRADRDAPAPAPPPPARLGALSSRAALGPVLLVRLALSSERGRRLALLGQVNLAPADLVRLAARVPGVRVAPQPLRGRAPLHVPAAGAAREALAGLDADDPLERAVVGLLPRLLPRALVEGYPLLVAESRRRFGQPAAVLHGSYGFDDLENEYLARCEAAGRGVAFAQHGGAAMQLAVAPGERHEYRPSSVRISWGGTGPGVRAAPNPYVGHLHDRHRGGSRVVIIESVTPPMSYPFRFSTVPLGNQVFSEEQRLVGFVRALGPSREHVVLKRYPYFNDDPGRHPELEALPAPPGRPRAGTYWMRRARVAVVTYPDTPFIEAMVIGAPTIGLWDPALWEMRPDATSHFDRLQELGVIQPDAQAAALHLDAIYDDPARWWETRELCDARRAFLERFAMPGDWLAEWTRMLRELAT